MGRLPDAIAELEQMLVMSREAGDRFAEARALVDMSLAHWLCFSSEHVPHTKSLAEEALRIGREIGDEESVAKSLSYIGLIHQMEGDLVKGDEKLEESLRISEAHGFKEAIARFPDVTLVAEVNGQGVRDRGRVAHDWNSGASAQ